MSTTTDIQRGDSAASAPLDPESGSPGAVTVEQPEPPSLLAYPATYLLIGLNVLVYALMFRFGPVPALLRGPGLHGRGIGELGLLLTRIFSEPFSERVLGYFGACTPLDVLGHGQWWRLVSSIFVHVTLLHLLLNMWCLWNLGLFGERLLGRPGLVAVYLLTGAAGMLSSLILSIHTGNLNVFVAGASGAVFGLAGILIVLLSNRKLAAPWEELRSLRLQVVFFALANLLLGMLPGLLPRLYPGLVRMLPFDIGNLPRIDNSAHLGGFLSGIALGLPLFPRMTSGRSSYRARQVLIFSSAALALSLVGYAVAAYAKAVQR